MKLSQLSQALWHRSAQPFQAVRSLLYKNPFSLLSIRSDLAGWVLEEEALALQRIVTRLGIEAKMNSGLSSLARQCCH